MGTIWIIGRKAVLATNGYQYIAEPFIAFATEAEADAACDMVEKLSGERPAKATAAFDPAASDRSNRSKGGIARAEKLSPERRPEIAGQAAIRRWVALANGERPNQDAR